MAKTPMYIDPIIIDIVANLGAPSGLHYDILRIKRKRNTHYRCKAQYSDKTQSILQYSL